MACVGYIKIYNNKYFAFNVRPKFVTNVLLNNTKITEVNRYNRQKVKLVNVKKIQKR